MIASARLTIDLGAIAANYRTICMRAAPAAVAGVVKADGYGLGARHVARTLLAQGCRSFFVALVSEAHDLIADLAGTADVFVLNGLLPGTERECSRLGAIPVLNSLDQVRSWSAQARCLGRVLPAALQVDTGMSRMGLSPAEVTVLLAQSDVLSGIDLRFLMSHLACSDDSHDPANMEQACRFRALAAQFPKLPLSLANSGGALLHQHHFDIVRAGIALYGGAAQADAAPLRPVVGLTAPIAQLRTVPTGARVGYGLTYRASRATVLATIPVGYADGLPRCLGNRGGAYIGGLRAPIVGRISMDSITLDVTDIPNQHLYEGAPVELIGPHQSLDQIAADAGTISYEILTQLSRRYVREYLPAPGSSFERSFAL